MTRVIPIFDNFVFDGINSLDYKVRISGDGTYRSAERDIESVTVPGRNGDLTIDRKRFKNSKQYYDAFITVNYQDNLSDFINAMLASPGYHRLEDSYHPGEYRMARYVGPLEPESFMDESGKFEIEFDCAPQRYLKTGEIPVVITGPATVQLFNPTWQTALPKITVTAGTGDIVVNSQHCVLAVNNGSTVIDSEIQDTYEGSTNRNGNITLSGGYPVLVPGANSVSIPAGVSVSIVPGWWKL